jgi:hypothetical protein
VAFLVLAHVDARHGVLVVEEDLAQRFRQFGLAHAGGAQEDERADGPLLIAHASTVAAHGIGHGAHGFVLTDHALVQFVLQLQSLVRSASSMRVTGTPVQRLTTAAISSTSTSSLIILLLACIRQFGLGGREFVLGLLHAAVADLGHLAEVAFAFGLCSIELQLLDLVLGAR